MRVSKPSPSMIVALIALVFAMTGTGIAAKTLITGKQIKDGSITSRDLARNAVTARNVAANAISARNVAADAITARNVAANAITEGKLADAAVSARKLANQAVTGEKVAPNAISAGALAPASVTEAALSPTSFANALYSGPQPTICSTGDITYSPKPCPPSPNWTLALDGTSVAMNSGPIDFPGVGSCFLRQPVPVTTSGALDVYQPGTYRVVLSATWQSGGGSVRQIGFRRKIGPLSGDGPVGGFIPGGPSTINPAAAAGQTTQTITANMALKRSDTIEVIAGSCGVSDTLGSLSVDVEKVITG